MTTTLETYTEAQVQSAYTKGFTRRSDRDKQTKLGPSEIGGCVYCVGYTMAAKLAEMPSRDDSFGYAAWIGTMAHYWLEQNLLLENPITGGALDTLREHKVKVFDIPDYGTINGSCDIFTPEFCETGDYKFPGKWSYEKVQIAIRKYHMALAKGDLEEAAKQGPSKQYRFQQQLYAHGLVQQGHEVERCRIIFLPRHTNAVSDIIHWVEPYQPEMVEKALARTIIIWEYVQSGQLGELPSDDDCYTCDRNGRGDLTNYNLATN